MKWRKKIHRLQVKVQSCATCLAIDWLEERNTETPGKAMKQMDIFARTRTSSSQREKCWRICDEGDINKPVRSGLHLYLVQTGS